MRRLLGATAGIGARAGAGNGAAIGSGSRISPHLGKVATTVRPNLTAGIISSTSHSSSSGTIGITPRRVTTTTIGTLGKTHGGVGPVATHHGTTGAVATIPAETAAKRVAAAAGKGGAPTIPRLTVEPP